MRSIWKGHIRFSLVTIPVRIYSAIEPAESIKFNQVHRSCNGPVGYDKRCKKCNQVLANEDIVKGYQYEPDQYVIMEKADFEKVRLPSTKIIEIEGFIDGSEMDPMLYEAPYFVGPDGAVSAKTYALFRQALRESGKFGMGKVVLREREDVVALSPHDSGLVLYKLRYPNEVRSMEAVPGIDTKAEINSEQLKLARSLLDSMTKPLGEIEMKDRYAEALREIIEARIKGQEIVSVAEEPKPVVDIMKALKQSIEQAKSKRQQMIKATGKPPEEEAKPKGRKRA
ncbi:MAG: Ku protein [Acidobacteria bacterium]|nr:Ku protein [Acidobacteriota bacterium]